MSKIHVLDRIDVTKYRVVIHTQTPSGNNAAGKPWKDIGLASFRIGITILAVGTGPGQITIAERNDIIAGNIAEIASIVKIDPNSVSLTALNIIVDKAISDWLNEMQFALNYYGFTS